ncbi:RNA polymerase sigma-70 factor [Limibacter armeniacum]|uniref:RNA polymerase sigma-70 factor n=1 Tax=Limibacter armeniacum TaxID=466084 RepID=UPI002FE5A7C7
MFAQSKELSEQLCQALAKGDIKAFDWIYQSYAPRLAAFLKSFAPDPSAMEDILQDTFMKVWTNREQLGSVRSVDAYLFTIARNTALTHLDRIGKQARYAQEASVFKDSVTTRTDREVEDKSTWELIQGIIDSMPDKRKEVFLMNRIQGKSYAEIAEELEISVKTVEKHISLAMSFLKDKTGGKLDMFSIMLFLFIKFF